MSLRWILPQANPDVIVFTVTPTASAKTVTLENFSAPYNCHVDWGDGQKSAQITGNGVVSHTYADTTPRQIAIRGILGGFWNATAISEGKTLVTSVDEVNSRSLLTLANTFRGCTALGTLPVRVDAPDVADFSYAFYQCRSVTSALPALWLSHPSAVHTGCFTDCFKSLYGQHGTGCSCRQYVAAVPGETYYEHYGRKACPSSTYHTTSEKTYYQQYGGSSCPYFKNPWVASSARCSSCKKYYHKGSFTLSGGGCSVSAGSYNRWYLTVASTPACPNCGYCGKGEETAPQCDSTCKRIFQQASSYYSCSHYGGNCKNGSCTRTYSSGQSAYYKCTKSGATCPTTTCPYPYANESDVDAAKAAGWA